MKLPVLRDLYDTVGERVLPLLHSAYSREECRQLEEEYHRLEGEPVSLPYVIDLRKVVSLMSTKIRLVGVDFEDEKRVAIKSLRELDLVLLAFHQYLERRNAASFPS